MRKRLCALLLACMLLLGAGAQAAGVGARQVNEAIECLKTTWGGVFADLGDAATGVLEIKNVRVLHLSGDYGEDAIAAEIFGDKAFVLEFLLYADMYGGGYTVDPGPMNTSVAIAPDGTMEVLAVNPFSEYRDRTNSSDFSHIIDRLLDFGSQYNKQYTLK